MSSGAPHPISLVVVVGMSGAGKTTASDALEDGGFFCVDNLPAGMITPLVEFDLASGGRQRRLALVVTVRNGGDRIALQRAIDDLEEAGHNVTLLFLDAEDAALLRRFSETRRRHPLDAEGRDLRAAVVAERALLAPLRERAEHVVDTTELAAGQLRAEVVERLSQRLPGQCAVTVQSFGFKYGVPHQADLLLDVRFLPNPYFVAELRALTGQQAQVAQFVLQSPDAVGFLERLDLLLQRLTVCHEAAGSAHVQVAIGCTGGRHRSVALAEEITRVLAARGLTAHVQHRDISK